MLSGIKCGIKKKKKKKNGGFYGWKKKIVCSLSAGKY